MYCKACCIVNVFCVCCHVLCNAHTRFASDAYWEMTLRGFGERYAAVGNIFSGLFCSVSDRPSAFKVYTTITITYFITLPL
jgi:hypothetical protein